MHSFDLLAQPWIPCTFLDGRHEELGLKDALGRAPEIREVFDPSPLVTVSLHRLMLAVLHRVFGPASSSDWRELWEACRFDSKQLDSYLETWRERFDLFHPVHPFYQVARLSPDDGGPVSKLGHEYAAGNNPTLFDHNTDDGPLVLTPAQAARRVVALQGFAVGGLLSVESGQDPKLHKSAKSAPLVGGAVALLRGDTLFQTLMLNMHRCCPAEGEPFEMLGQDSPAWELSSATLPGERRPRGYLDLLTWQSRCVRLHPSEDASGELFIRSATVTKGHQFPTDWTLHGRETMLSFRKLSKPQKGQAPWIPIGFEEDRVMWRDSLSLFQSMAETRCRPKTVDWIADLVMAGALDRSRTLRLDLFGLCSDKAKLIRGGEGDCGTWPWMRGSEERVAGSRWPGV